MKCGTEDSLELGIELKILNPNSSLLPLNIDAMASLYMAWYIFNQCEIIIN